jgi:hypothetical protein
VIARTDGAHAQTALSAESVDAIDAVFADMEALPHTAPRLSPARAAPQAALDLDPSLPA